MRLRKPGIALLVAAGLALIGCGGAPPPKPVKHDKDKTKWEPIEVPEKIADAERSSLEKVLYLMPLRHPDRGALRDRLADSYVVSFDALADDAFDARLEAFESALALHAPTDFKPGRVSGALAPMARWVIEHFEQRGDEALVLAALRFLMLAEPDDERHGERYTDLAEWSESVRETIPDEMDRYTSTIEMYTRMLRLVPDREVVDHLSSLLVARHMMVLSFIRRLDEEGSAFSPFLLRALLQEGGLARDMIYVYFLAGDPAGALEQIEGLGSEAGIETEYIELLRDINRGEEMAENYFALAGLLGSADPRSGLRACILARQHDRSDPRFPVCAGRFFERLGRPECAVDLYTEAADAAPEEEVFTQVIELVRVAMFEIHLAEKTAEAKRVIEIVDGLVDRALEHVTEDDPESDLALSSAHALFTAGEVEFDDGRIDSAMGHFERAREIWENLFPAQMKLAEILYLRREYDAALKLLEEALRAARNQDDVSRHYWAALLHERRGDCLYVLGETDAARREYRAALARWDDVQLSPAQAPEAAVRQGVLQDRLGNHEESQVAFRLAVRLDPDRRATYAELLSYLVIRGRLEEAVEFYRLAFNQDRIEGMWKIYYSLWVEGLARRGGDASVDLARGYLEQSDGETWQDNLARFFSGRITFEQLKERATNEGQLVETDYYSALRHLAKGDKKKARKLLDEVIASDLMGFFEYRMAWELLRTEF
jgi:tetratricopeptide (TPR) repeat protein